MERAIPPIVAMNPGIRTRRRVSGSRTPAKLTPWEDWGVSNLSEYDGVVWYRARVKLSASQARQAAKISLGVIDDVDEVWVNGQPMASGFG